MTDLEKFQATEKYLTWRDHPYTKLVMVHLGNKLDTTHLDAENSVKKKNRLTYIEHARIIREILKDLSSPLKVKQPQKNTQEEIEIES
jgi:hypothetical protein